MFKNTRLSAFVAAVLFSVTAATALVATPAFADAPASAAASAPAATPDATAASAPAAPATPDAAAPAPAPSDAVPGKEEVSNPFGIQAVWAGGFVPRATLIILALMSMGSWYIIVTKLLDQMKIFKQSKETATKFWKAPSIARRFGSAERRQPVPLHRRIRHQGHRPP